MRTNSPLGETLIQTGPFPTSENFRDCLTVVTAIGVYPQDFDASVIVAERVVQAYRPDAVRKTTADTLAKIDPDKDAAPLAFYYQRHARSIHGACP